MKRLLEIEYQGLTEKQVVLNRKQYGTNQITGKPADGFFKLLGESLGDPIIRILLIALGIKLIFLLKDFDWYETVGIVIAIFLASFISTLSEYGSEKAFERLQDESSKIKCRVKRNGKVEEIIIDDVVKEDIVILQAGDKIPADGVVVQGTVSVDESSINGESKEAYKEAILKGQKEYQDQHLVYRGTVVYSGEAQMLVRNVGEHTFYGNLAKEIQEKQPDSPLKIRLRELAKVISYIGYVGAFLVSVSYLFSVIIIDNHFVWADIIATITNIPLLIGHILYALTLSVTIIVVAVPEGLPMMITLVLSSNMKRMLRNNVLVRKMVGIETAGSLNILFTDKTGTLTKGKLEVVSFLTGDLKRYESFQQIPDQYKIKQLLAKSILYNSASHYDQDKKIVVGGNITDRCLLQYIAPYQHYAVRKISQVPFNSKDKYSMAVIEDEKKKKLIKGAPEKILEACTHYYDQQGNSKLLTSKKRVQLEIEKATRKGIRLIALAISNEVNDPEFRNCTLVGIVLIKDDVRKESKQGVKEVQEAGIQVVMITGDNKQTATAIGKDVGLLTGIDDLVLTSEELNQKSDEELKTLLPRLRIVARSLPQDKSRLVRLSQELELVVGMTGDGVNDAPALKKADVGFAMGSGTEVAKEAGDIVILDDNFISISKAILLGRTIFKSIRKFIIFQLTVNLCAVSLSIIGPFIGIDTPVTVIQMLWVNMVMDTLAGLAFAYEAPLKEYMKEPPKKKEEPIINRYMWHEILFTGCYSAVLCVIFLKAPFIHSMFRLEEHNLYFMTAFFGLFIFMAIFNCFNARTHRLNLLAHIFRNRVFIMTILFIIIVQILLIYYGGSLFRTAGLTLKEFYVMLLLALSVIPVDWCRKLFLRHRDIIGGT